MRAAPALILLGLLAAVPLAAEDRTVPTVFIPDTLTSPGHPVVLEAQVRQSGALLRSGIGGEQVEFLVGGKSVGSAMTGGDGRALLEYTPKMRGNLPVAAQVKESSRVSKAEGTGTLFSWERRRPILLIEMESLTEPIPVPALPVPSIPGSPGSLLLGRPQPDAAEEVKRLTDFYFNAVYLFRSRVASPSDTREVRDWLKTGKFPPGYIVHVGPGQEAVEERIDSLRQEGWDNVKAGIGRTKEFAAALIGRRLEVVIVSASEERDFPRKAQIARTWKEVRKKRL